MRMSFEIFKIKDPFYPITTHCYWILQVVAILFLLADVDYLSGKNYSASPSKLAYFETDTIETPLKLGQTIQKTTQGSVSHFYSLSLEKGQYLHVQVVQYDADMVAVLTGSCLDSIEVFDAPTGMRGTENIYLEVPEACTIKIELHTVSKYAQVGKYDIKIAALRPVTNPDKQWLAAYKTVRKADRLRAKPTTRAESISEYKLAIEQWKTLGDTEQQAWATRAMGFSVRGLGDDDKALDIFQQASPLWAKVGDVRSEAFNYVILASIHKKYKRFQESLDLNFKAMDCWRKADDIYEITATLSNISSLYMMQSQKEISIKYYEETLKSAEKSGSNALRARMFRELGNAWLTFGDKKKVVYYYKKSLELRQKTPNLPEEGRSLILLADQLLDLGKKKEATNYYQKAAIIWKQLGNKKEMEAVDAKLAKLIIRV